MTLQKLGANHIIERSSQNIANEVTKITDGKGVDIIIDHVGSATWATSIAILKIGGKMAVCSMTSGNDATVPGRMFYSKQITIMGALLGSKRQLVKLMNFIRGNKTLPIIDSIFELHNAEEALEMMEAGMHAGKILLKC
ncbi:MAG TPA: zinc-binding dehydrogenase [Nitrososphaera sp.]|jgi:NADPH:quinone reductase-like Zn-dependent oxidoreductase|nr:zinc-binding dehydrogenase [Nitrososphaera sp.]